MLTKVTVVAFSYSSSTLQNQPEKNAEVHLAIVEAHLELLETPLEQETLTLEK